MSPAATRAPEVWKTTVGAMAQKSPRSWWRVDGATRVWSALWLAEAAAQILISAHLYGATVTASNKAQLALGCVALCGVRPLLIAAMALRWLDNVNEIPVTYDSTYWTIQCDGAVIIALLFNKDFASCAAVVKKQLACFYFAAFFWKLNTAFLDSRSSCGTVFAVQIAATLGLPAQAIASVAPIMTLGLEGSIGSLMLAGAFLDSDVASRLGGLAALALHVAIALTPRPNNIASFSLTCCVRILFFAPASSVERLFDDLRVLSAGAFLAVLVGAGLDLGYQELNFCVMIPCFFLDAWAFATPAPSQKRSSSFLWVVLAVVYCSSPVVGWDLGSPNMYGNLRVHAGSNHLLMPTGLLFDSPVFAAATVVRVESSNSSALVRVFPGELTSALRPSGVDEILKSVGQSGRFFNGAKNIVLGPDYNLEIPAVAARYTLPAPGFARVLRLARAADEPFEVTYDVLDGLKGDERWRANSVKRRVTATFNAAGVATCRVLKPQDGPCDEDELVFYPPPTKYHLENYFVFVPYPILEDHYTDTVGQVACFGP